MKTKGLTLKEAVEAAENGKIVKKVHLKILYI